MARLLRSVSERKTSRLCEFFELILRQTLFQDCRRLPPLERENASTPPCCGQPGRVVPPSSLRTFWSSSDSSTARSRSPAASSRSRTPSSTRSSALTLPSSETDVGYRHSGHRINLWQLAGGSSAPRCVSMARRHVSQKLCLHWSSRGHRRPALKSS